MKQTSPSTVLVVGLGNPDCGDDGVGPLVVRKLTGLLPPDVAVALPGGDVPTLITQWADFDSVICIDAAAFVTTPGRIHRSGGAGSDFARARPATSSHMLGLGDAIELSRMLGQAPRNIIVFAVEGACFAVGAPMAPQVAAAADEVASRVVAEVARLRARSGDSPSA